MKTSDNLLEERSRPLSDRLLKAFRGVSGELLLVPLTTRLLFEILEMIALGCERWQRALVELKRRGGLSG
jgi:hypothetical protein